MVVPRLIPSDLFVEDPERIPSEREPDDPRFIPSVREDDPERIPSDLEVEPREPEIPSLLLLTVPRLSVLEPLLILALRSVAARPVWILPERSRVIADERLPLEFP